MGPSGCGKTTLLDILAGKKKAQKHTDLTGEVYLDGLRTDSYFRRVATYVGQSDVMPPHIRVCEALRFFTELSHPTDGDKSKTDKVQEALLGTLGLGRVKDTIVGDATVRGVSGGQRRRVSLACGAATMSKVMFCDEPTSGLSATDAEIVVHALKNLCTDYGTTIFVVIHQPRLEVARFFDTLVMLTSNPGRIVYSGPMADAAAYWESLGHPVPPMVNPTDHFLDVITPGAPKAAVDLFVRAYEQKQLPAIRAAVAKEIARKDGLSPLRMLEKECESRQKIFGKAPNYPPSHYSVGFGKQLRVVFARKLSLTRRQKMILVVTIGQKIAVGLVVGLLFWDLYNQAPVNTRSASTGACNHSAPTANDTMAQSQPPAQRNAPEERNVVTLLFVSLLTVCLSGIVLIAPQVAERTIMKIETSEKLYSEAAHIITILVIDTLFVVIGNAFFLLIVFAMAAVPFDSVPALLFHFFMASFACESVFAAIAAVANNAQNAFTISIPFVLLFMMFSGSLVPKNAMPNFLNWLLYVSPFFWALENSLSELFGDNPYSKAALESYPGYQLDFDSGIGTGVCLAYFIIFRILQALALHFLNNIAH